ncbi:acyl-homoserine-lactone synthase [Rhizorhabdus sp. FW153]|uniref:acyl-homoserine-lactone synthase n=1 Tax=Rhizorhabdus sp. FW153 TaxID=3400216 RepID=UPI003CEC4F75
MLHIKRFQADPAGDAVLMAMFAARKSVFVDLLKWDVPVFAGAYEIDQFDDVHTTYLVLTADDNRHLGSARLLRTDRPHILDSFYADLCTDTVPRGPDIYEITRFCLDRRLRALERRAVRNTLVIALVDHALREGVSRYTALADIGWARQILDFGWAATLLGNPRDYDGQTLAALNIAIRRDTRQRLAAAGIVAAASICGSLAIAA